MFNSIQTNASISILIIPHDPTKQPVSLREFPHIQYMSNTPISIQTHKANVTNILRDVVQARTSSMLSALGIEAQEAETHVNVKLLIVEAAPEDMNPGDEHVQLF